MRQLVLSDKNTGITPKKENKIRTTDITKDKPQKTHSFTSRTKTTHPQTAKLQRTERHHIRKHCQTTPITALSILSTRNYKSTTSQHSTHLHTTAILGSERSTRREQELIQAPSQVGGGGRMRRCRRRRDTPRCSRARTNGGDVEETETEDDRANPHNADPEAYQSGETDWGRRK